MTYFNPLTGSILQSTQVQRTQSADKDRQSRQQAPQQPKKPATKEDEFSPTAETADAPSQVHDDQAKRQRQHNPHREPPQVDEDGEQPPHLDLKA